MLSTAFIHELKLVAMSLRAKAAAMSLKSKTLDIHFDTVTL